MPMPLDQWSRWESHSVTTEYDLRKVVIQQNARRFPRLMTWLGFVVECLVGVGKIWISSR